MADRFMPKPGDVFDGKGGRRVVVTVWHTRAGALQEVEWKRPDTTRTSRAWCSTWETWAKTAKPVEGP